MIRRRLNFALKKRSTLAIFLSTLDPMLRRVTGNFSRIGRGQVGLIDQAIAYCTIVYVDETDNKAIDTGLFRASRAYEEAVHAGPTAVYAFLLGYPKGADLHVHLSGAVYAETFIRDAAEDGICVDTANLKFAKPPCTVPIGL